MWIALDFCLLLDFLLHLSVMQRVNKTITGNFINEHVQHASQRLNELHCVAVWEIQKAQRSKTLPLE